MRIGLFMGDSTCSVSGVWLIRYGTLHSREALMMYDRRI